MDCFSFACDRAGIIASGIAVAALVASDPAPAETLRIRTQPGGVVIAEDLDGHRVWMVKTRRAHPPQVRTTTGGGLIIDESMVVDTEGRVVEVRLAAPDRTAPDAVPDLRGAPAATLTTEPGQGAEVMWEPLVDLAVIATPITDPPVFDQDGNALFFLKTSIEGGGWEIIPVRSRGRANEWELLPPIGEGDNILDGATASDGARRLVVAWRRRVSGVNNIDVVRYSLETGWTRPETILSTTDFFQNLSAGADADGNIVIGYDLDGNTMFSFVYNVATQQWSESQRLSPEEASNVAAATIVQNAAGTGVYAVFYVTSPLEASGVYVARFDTASATWGPARRLPGSRGAELPGGDNTGSKIAAAVDSAGALTTLFLRCQRPEDFSPCAVLGSRVEDEGTLAAPTLLGVQRLTSQDWLNGSADADANANGDVLFTYHRGIGVDSPPAGSEYIVAHYDGQTRRWQPLRRVFLTEGASLGRTKVAFRTGDSAVVTFWDRNAEPGRISSRLFDGENWSSQKLEIPTEFNHTNHEFATIDGNVAMWLINPGPFATWLFATEPPAESDLPP